MRIPCWPGLVIAAACGAVDKSPIDAAAPADAARDDAPTLDAPAARCNPSLPFDTPVALATLNSASDDHMPVLSVDELTLYYASNRPGGLGGYDLYVATRTSPTAAFGAPALINGVNSVDAESRPALTADGLTMYAEIKRGTNPYHLERATRASLAASFGPMSPVAALNSTASDVAPTVLPDGRAIYFISGRSGANRLYRADGSGGNFGTPVLATGINLQGTIVDYPMISSDDLTLMFPAPGPAGGLDIFAATRPSVAQGFGAPVALTELNTAGGDYPGWLSPDGCVLYFVRAVATTGLDLFVARRPLM